MRANEAVYEESYMHLFSQRFFVSSFGHNALGANVLTKLYTLHLSWYGEIPGQHLD